MDFVVRMRNQALAQGHEPAPPDTSMFKAVVGTTVGEDGRIYERLVDRPPPPTGTYHTNTDNEALVAKQGYDAGTPVRHKHEVEHMADMQPEDFRTGGGGHFNQLDDGQRTDRLRYIAAESVVDTQENLQGDTVPERPANFRGYTNIADYQNITRPVPKTKRNTRTRGVASTGRAVPAAAMQPMTKSRVFLPGVTDRDNRAAPTPARGQRAVAVSAVDPQIAASTRAQLATPGLRNQADQNPGPAADPVVRLTAQRARALPQSSDRAGSVRAASAEVSETRRPERALSEPLPSNHSAGDRSAAFKVHSLALPRRAKLPPTLLRPTTGDTRGVTDIGLGDRSQKPEPAGARISTMPMATGGRAGELPRVGLHEDAPEAMLGAVGQMSESGASHDMSFRSVIENAPVEPQAAGRFAGGAAQAAVGAGQTERLPTQSGANDLPLRSYKKSD